LKSYGEFVKESIENYEKLPQETSEIYKRYFINIPLDLKGIESPDITAAGAAGAQEAIKNELAKFNLKFDVLLDGEKSTTSSQFVRIIRAEQAGNMLEKSMYEIGEDKYVAYVRAYSRECVLIEVPDGIATEINILVMGPSKQQNASIFVKVGNGSTVDIFEYYGSASDSMSCTGTIHEIDVGKGSKLDINSLHNENKNSVSLCFSKNRIGEDSHLTLNAVYNGAMHTRVRNVISATDRSSKVNVNEVIFGSSDQKFDVSTYIVNHAPHTVAELESKAALMDSSFCIMKGFAKIEKGAAKAKSYVYERGILLDKNAKVYGLPDMSVDENDVKATHSSATAPVDPESVFYLMSKGIDEVGVRKLLVTGFFASSISRMQSSIMKELSMSLINNKLETNKYGEIPKMSTRNMWVVQDTKETDMFKGHYTYRGAE
jgi:Fe-S cluster assembly scaffold protein SufB